MPVRKDLKTEIFWSCATGNFKTKMTGGLGRFKKQFRADCTNKEYESFFYLRKGFRL
jgi:hypothetical protein